MGPFRSERRVAGHVMDFVRNNLPSPPAPLPEGEGSNLRIASFDHVAAFQACPEFLALVSEYPCHRPAQLISPTAYPTFQALESAVGFCLHGCVECVVAPEQNIHGILTAKETVNKLLLDAAYRTLVCESGTPLDRDHLPREWTGPDGPVARPCVVRCRRLGADGRRNSDDRRTAVRGRDGSRDCRSPGGSRRVVSRVSDRLGACRPASVRDSSRYVVLKSGTPRGLSRPWESSRVRRTSRTAACTPNRRTPTTSLTAAPTTRATARNSWAATKA